MDFKLILQETLNETLKGATSLMSISAHVLHTDIKLNSIKSYYHHGPLPELG